MLHVSQFDSDPAEAGVWLPTTWRGAIAAAVIGAVIGGFVVAIVMFVLNHLSVSWH